MAYLSPRVVANLQIRDPFSVIHLAYSPSSTNVHTILLLAESVGFEDSSLRRGAANEVPIQQACGEQLRSLDADWATTRRW